jgi:hypothetical protein
MKKIIAPIKKELILGELTSDRLVRRTKRLNNEIYDISATSAPQVMLELGRLREFTFREAGGGTGKEVDIDEYDYLFKHLVLWNPSHNEIIGSYRYALMRDLIEGDTIQSPTRKLFNFSPTFIRDYLPVTIELGRSFVQPKYQPRVDNRGGIFSLFNLFSGLEWLVGMYPDMEYFFGKFTMYSDYDSRARNLLLNYLKRKFPDPDKLVRPKKDLRVRYIRRNFAILKSIFNQQTYRDQKIFLEKYLSKYGEDIQPLVDKYMGLSSTMKIFGTAHHDEFGEALETGMLIKMIDIHPEIIDLFRSNIKDI